MANKRNIANLKKPKQPDSLKGVNGKKTEPEPGRSNAPHYDTDQRGQEANVDVEISKGSMGDVFQTDNRPKNTN